MTKNIIHGIECDKPTKKQIIAVQGLEKKDGTSNGYYGLIPQTTPLQVKFKKLDKNAILPTKAYDTDAGIDLYALYGVRIAPNDVYKISTGIACNFPPGYCGIIKGRSSMGSKNLHVLAGVIDETYTGELVVCLANLNSNVGVNDDNDVYNSHNDYIVKSGDKIAQMLIVPVPKIEIVEVETLENRERGSRGFGSSGR